MPPPRPTTVSRRTGLLGLLGLLGLVGTAGCTDGDGRAPRPATAPGTPTGAVLDSRLPVPSSAQEVDPPDVALAAEVLAEEQAMLDLVDATLAAHPRLSDRPGDRPGERLGERLETTRSVHRQHVALLVDTAPEPARSVPPPSAGSVPRVPGDPRKALAAVARAEVRLSLAEQRSASAAVSGAFARMLASMAAAAAQQAAVLRDSAGGRP